MSDIQQTPRPRRERPKALRLTDAAAEQIRSVMSRGDKPYVGIRVGLKNAGCAGMSYTMDYAETQLPLDEVVEERTLLVEEELGEAVVPHGDAGVDPGPARDQVGREGNRTALAFDLGHQQPLGCARRRSGSSTPVRGSRSAARR